jgi:hypothetical protein
MDGKENGDQKRAMRGAVSLKMSAEEKKRRLVTDLFGPEFVMDKRYEDAI